MYEVSVKDYVTDTVLFEGAQASRTGLFHILKRFGDFKPTEAEFYIENLDADGERSAITHALSDGMYVVSAMTEKRAIELA